MIPTLVVCPVNFAYINGNCYQITEMVYTWIDAVSACQDQGAYLATLHSQAEVRWVYEYFRTEGKTSNSIWIGLNDIAKEGNYQWIDGRGNYSSFSYWISGEPNNSGGDQNCVVLWAGYLGKWGDIACANVFPALCKWNASITVAPEGKYWILPQTILYV